MPEPTLQQVFGAGATQTATTLTIEKADLTAVGLTASATNTAESLFVGLLLLAKAVLTAAGLESNPDQSISIEDSFDSLVTRNNQTFRQKTYSINLQKLDTGATIDPDDY
ncbi:hypothetical protein IQ230_14015 [Gloeocapsopsis crepidinum LEGE 06123]|uniref:Uncharacterized protein n=1 Tax=Gloeocapsopsis crepidinum LEGE 06123 TaxID=588587 RepID=A0ABR9UTS3_9CHRO|nr:hypothetical protein [Gloeocapsopsis crepidinum]MBE9191443.1 hypothetical protein [Gloeocapsopsis crepidinum LEGE 06123]